MAASLETVEGKLLVLGGNLVTSDPYGHCCCGDPYGCEVCCLLLNPKALDPQLIEQISEFHWREENSEFIIDHYIELNPDPTDEEVCTTVKVSWEITPKTSTPEPFGILVTWGPGWVPLDASPSGYIEEIPQTIQWEQTTELEGHVELEIDWCESDQEDPLKWLINLSFSTSPTENVFGIAHSFDECGFPSEALCCEDECEDCCLLIPWGEFNTEGNLVGNSAEVSATLEMPTPWSRKVCADDNIKLRLTKLTEVNNYPYVEFGRLWKYVNHNPGMADTGDLDQGVINELGLVEWHDNGPNGEGYYEVELSLDPGWTAPEIGKPSNIIYGSREAQADVITIEWCGNEDFCSPCSVTCQACRGRIPCGVDPDLPPPYKHANDGTATFRDHTEMLEVVAESNYVDVPGNVNLTIRLRPSQIPVNNWNVKVCVNWEGLTNDSVTLTPGTQVLTPDPNGSTGEICVTSDSVLEFQFSGSVVCSDEDSGAATINISVSFPSTAPTNAFGDDVTTGDGLSVEYQPCVDGDQNCCCDSYVPCCNNKCCFPVEGAKTYEVGDEETYFELEGGPIQDFELTASRGPSTIKVEMTKAFHYYTFINSAMPGCDPLWLPVGCTFAVDLIVTESDHPLVPVGTEYLKIAVFPADHSGPWQYEPFDLVAFWTVENSSDLFDCSGTGEWQQNPDELGSESGSITVSNGYEHGYDCTATLEAPGFLYDPIEEEYVRSSDPQVEDCIDAEGMAF